MSIVIIIIIIVTLVMFLVIISHALYADNFESIDLDILGTAVC